MLLKKSEADIQAAQLLLSPVGNPTNDEMLFDLAAYHVQQGIEKLLKYTLVDICGLDEASKKFRTHKIATLIDMVESSSDIIISDELKEKSNDITMWEAQSRYGESPIAVETEIKSAIDTYCELKKYIENYKRK